MISIRDFHPSDSTRLWSVFYSAIHQIAAADYTADQLEAWASSQPDLGKWALRIEGFRPFVAEIDGRIVGYADLQPGGYIDGHMRSLRLTLFVLCAVIAFVAAFCIDVFVASGIWLVADPHPSSHVNVIIGDAAVYGSALVAGAISFWAVIRLRRKGR